MDQGLNNLPVLVDLAVSGLSASLVITDNLSTATGLIEQHPLAAYVLVFLLAMSEALPRIAIGFLMGVRLLVGLFHRVPTEPRSPSATAARTLPLAFYAAIIGQACLGFVARYVTFSAAPLHVAGSWVILGMVAVHVAAAVWHTVVLKDDTIDRMARLPDKATH